MPFDQNMARVFEGEHMFIAWKYFMQVEALKSFTDKRGYSPLHLSRKEYFNFGGYGWGCR